MPLSYFAQHTDIRYDEKQISKGISALSSWSSSIRIAGCCKTAKICSLIENKDWKNIPRKNNSS